MRTLSPSHVISMLQKRPPRRWVVSVQPSGIAMLSAPPIEPPAPEVPPLDAPAPGEPPCPATGAPPRPAPDPAPPDVSPPALRPPVLVAAAPPEPGSPACPPPSSPAPDDGARLPFLLADLPQAAQRTRAATQSSMRCARAPSSRWAIVHEPRRFEVCTAARGGKPQPISPPSCTFRAPLEGTRDFRRAVHRWRPAFVRSDGDVVTKRRKSVMATVPPTGGFGEGGGHP